MDKNFTSFESKKFGFNNVTNIGINISKNISDTITFIDSLYQEFNTLNIFNWSDDFFNNIISVIFEKYRNSLNIFPTIQSIFPTIKNQTFNTRNFSSQFCLYLVKQELLKTNNFSSIKINNCNITFDDGFNKYFKETSDKTDLYKRRKIKLEIFNIDYTYFNINSVNKTTISYDKNKSKQMKYKIFQGIYPTDTLYDFSIDGYYNNFASINFYFSDLSDNYERIEKIKNIYSEFILYVICSNVLIWVLVFLFVFIIVFRVSNNISEPIDKLIQFVSMNNKSNKELNKYLKNLSYKDDSTINDLFVLCKKLIIGGFKKEVDEEYQQKKKMKTINAYNNISLVKSNNMIINESEIMKGEKKQVINYFEETSIFKNKKYLALNSDISEINDKKISHSVLSGPLFTGKFYQNNKGYLIKDKDLFEKITNEINVRKKKEDNKSKNTNDKNNRNK